MIGPQATVVVTNPSGLMPLLSVLYGWFVDAGDAMVGLSEPEAQRTLTEAAFLAMVLNRFGEFGALRSDLDMHDWHLGRSWRSSD